MLGVQDLSLIKYIATDLVAPLPEMISDENENQNLSPYN